MKRAIAMLLTCCMAALTLSACAAAPSFTGVEDGVLTVAMECAYAPYNWTQSTEENGAVPIKDSSDYANGYDVMMAKKISEYNGWELEIVRLDWDSLVPAVQTGQVDAVIAGQSMTEDRMKQVDFAGPYLYASIVCLTLKSSPCANAKGISDLSGSTCTSQLGTIWYDTCLPQITGATVKEAKESAPAMLMALASGDVDFVCTDMPTAQAALIVYPEMTLLDFSGSGDDFTVDEGEINIGISLQKGNKTLKTAIDAALTGLTAEDFNEIMASAIAIQPIS
ncbi:MAG TPA: transporter substrate-binding domain-containing protein [Clostridia bacterium]|nr:transporter substrate-binding domain-containing protein [Clostridia bacterium]